ncbi:FixH family protein [Arenibaculum pallidiluteum]|uniref:FixH family protein n=1 Tax=Arenibaculum pallidiluteum TaxID=2812559 RepID=UPI001A97D204|nr:FixH family protein [Arenibaculum pallidiluteum]
MAFEQTIGTAKQARPRGWWIPYVFVGGFLLVIAVNAAMITIALKTWGGLETENHYLKGVAFNRALEGVHEQERRGWHVEFRSEAPGGGIARVVFSLADAAGAPLTGAAVRVEMMRPTSQGYDFTAMLAETAPGRYAADVKTPLPGQWDLRVVAEHPRGGWQQPQRTRLIVRD